MAMETSRTPLGLSPRAPAGLVVLAVLFTVVLLSSLTWSLVRGASQETGPQRVEAIGDFMMAAALGAWVCARTELRRRGLAPTSDERFSWLDLPARRAAYEAEVAPRIPVALRGLDAVRKPLFFGGYVVVVLAEPIAHLLRWVP